MPLQRKRRTKFISGMLIRLLAPLSFVVLVVTVSYLQSAKDAGELVTLLSIIMVCSTIGRLGFDQLILEKGWKAWKNEMY